MIQDAREEILDAERMLHEVDDEGIRLHAQCLRGLLALNEQSLEEAERRYRDVITRADAADYPEIGVIARNGLTATLQAQSKDGEMDALTEETLGLALKTFGEEHLETAIAANNRGDVLTKLGHRELALAAYEPALAAFKSSGNSVHPGALVLRHNLGLLLRGLGRETEGRALTAEAVELRQRVYGEGDAIAIKYLQHAGFVDAQSETPSAGVELLDRALRLLHRHHQDSRIWINQCRGQLAFAHGMAGDTSESDRLFAETIDEAISLGRPIGVLLNNYSVVLRKAGRLTESKAMGDRAIEKSRAEHGDTSRPMAAIRLNLAKTLIELDEPEPAREQLLECRRIRVELLGENHPAVQQVDDLLLEIGQHTLD